MLLPESVLLGLFPQGLVLSRPASWDGGDDGVFAVDVSGFFQVGVDSFKDGSWGKHREEGCFINRNGTVGI
jgi:hypothetical protein